MFKSILIFMMASLLSFCKSPRQETSPDINVVKGQLGSLPANYSYKGKIEEHCFYPRKTIRSVTDEVGVIILVDSTYLLSSDKRYQPCEIPQHFKKEGMPIVFSGEKLEIFPHERRMAAPFRLLKLSFNE